MAIDFHIVYTPKEKIYPNSRFLVSARQLHNYIGQENANKALKAAYDLIENKATLKFRKYGKIEIYLK